MAHTDLTSYQRAKALNSRLVAAGNVTAWDDVRRNRAEIEWEWDELKDPNGPYWDDFACGLALLLCADAYMAEDGTDPLIGATADELIGALAAAGIPATVKQTGGNCATIYAGDTKQVAIGAGAYDWDQPGASRFDVDILSVGPADNDDGWSDVATVDELVEMVQHFLGHDR